MSNETNALQKDFEIFVNDQCKEALDTLEKKLEKKLDFSDHLKLLEWTKYKDVYVPRHIIHNAKVKYGIFSSIYFLIFVFMLGFTYLATDIFFVGSDNLIQAIKILLTIVVVSVINITAHMIIYTTYINDYLRNVEIFEKPEVQVKDFTLADPEEEQTYELDEEGNYKVVKQVTVSKFKEFGANPYKKYKERIIKFRKNNYTNKKYLLLTLFFIFSACNFFIVSVKSAEFTSKSNLNYAITGFNLLLPLIAAYLSTEIEKFKYILNIYKYYLGYNKITLENQTKDQNNEEEVYYKKTLQNVARKYYTKILNEKLKLEKKNKNPLQNTNVEHIENLDVFTYYLHRHNTNFDLT